jgi:hypothetical protein
MRIDSAPGIFRGKAKYTSNGHTAGMSKVIARKEGKLDYKILFDESTKVQPMWVDYDTLRIL